VKLVIFDCDGVLVDSEPIANRVLAEQLAAVGLNLSARQVMGRFVGRTREGCLALAAEMLGRELPAGFGEQWDGALFAAFTRELKPVDGVLDLLRDLAVPFCVASNSTPERMRASLTATGLLPFFEDRMFSATAVARPKPAPDLFLHAARTMNAEPADCVVIEDTLGGAKAAVAAGMKVLAYVGGGYSSAEAMKNEGAVPFKAMSELPGLL
jgi:HAD superfamily hydrolase (TIGR01509 family)